jgi:hypothetical protein
MGLLERAQFVEQKQVKFQETPSGLLKRASLIHTLMEKKEEQFPKEEPFLEKKKPIEFLQKDRPNP